MNIRRSFLNVKQTPIEAAEALDQIVTRMVQQFEDVHFRAQAVHHLDTRSGDEFYTVYDPFTDSCLVVWLSPSWHGEGILEMARDVMSQQGKR
jgi:hypothetical protein